MMKLCGLFDTASFDFAQSSAVLLLIKSRRGENERASDTDLNEHEYFIHEKDDDDDDDDNDRNVLTRGVVNY